MLQPVCEFVCVRGFNMGCGDTNLFIQSHFGDLPSLWRQIQVTRLGEDLIYKVRVSL